MFALIPSQAHALFSQIISVNGKTIVTRGLGGATASVTQTPFGTTVTMSSGSSATSPLSQFLYTLLPSKKVAAYIAAAALLAYLGYRWYTSTQSSSTDSEDKNQESDVSDKPSGYIVPNVSHK
jgi:hypothetical protein